VQNCFKICDRQALHAKSLEFLHPTNEEEMKFNSELPEDFSLLLEKWRRYATHQK
jgi:23S rRNA pseudouridine1911/1915/1917 synthase